MGMGMDPTTTPKRNQLGKIAQTPLPIFNCPSRRSAINYPNTYYSQVNITPVATAARTDYAANAGSSQGFVYFNPGGTDPRVVDAPGYNGWPSSPSSGLFLQWKVFDGVVYIISCLKMAEIADGASNTYIFGEKVMNPDYYLDGYWDPGDNNPIYGGFDWDWERCSLWDANRKIWSGPYQDTPGAGFDDSNFGSAHPNGLNMAFCDGSVQAISYSIDRETHRCLCSRSDGKSIDSKKF
jgi:prepilin-type processing-associated H-X9-DG protein